MAQESRIINVDEILYKKCNSCLDVKLIEDFQYRGDDKRYLRSACTTCRKQKIKDYHKKLRIETLKYYSGDPPKCACCGEMRYEFLAFDHIEGGGYKQKKQGKWGHLYQWLYSHNYPEGFRVLCHNCNQALGAYGYCPHDKEKAG